MTQILHIVKIDFCLKSSLLDSDIYGNRQLCLNYSLIQRGENVISNKTLKNIEHQFSI